MRFFFLKTTANSEMAVSSTASASGVVYSGMKVAVMVPGAVMVAVVAFDCLFAMVMPVVAFHDVKL